MIASIVALVTIPANLAQSVVGRGSLGSEISKRRGSDWDELGFAGWSQRIFRCQTVKNRPPERLLESKWMHGGMRWGAVARKRTTATGPDDRP